MRCMYLSFECVSSHGHPSVDFLTAGPSSGVSLFSTALKSTRWASSLNVCDDVGFLRTVEGIALNLHDKKALTLDKFLRPHNLSV